MPSRCCVPYCNGNYDTGPKVSVFSFPKDEEIKQKWLSVIQRDNFQPSRSSKVCELHFKETDFEKNAVAYDENTGDIITVPLERKRFKKCSFPSVFPNYPTSMLPAAQESRKDPDERRIEKEMKNIQDALKESIRSYEVYVEERKINSLDDVKNCVNNFGLSNFWLMYNCNSDFIYLIHIETCPEPFLQYTVKIDKDLNLTVNMEKTPVKKISTHSFPLKVNSYNDILQVLDFLEQNYSNSEKSPNLIIDTIINLLDQISLKENENCIKFIQEQLKLIISHKNNFRYSTDLLIFASLLKSISPHAYKFIRSSNIVKLPHPCTLQRICNNFNLSPQLEMLDENFLMYIRNRVCFIENHEKIVTLLLDEIHVKSLFDYKGGSIVGAAFNSEKAANSAFVFMISSILSQFKEVVHIMPVHTINFSLLHEMIKKVVLGLESMELKVICAVTDNNSINVKSMSSFMTSPQRSYVYPHPANEKRPLFYLIDSVHIFKNIRNNWLNQKNSGKCFYYPNFENPNSPQFHTARFDAIKELHDIEYDKLCKYSVGLTLKSIFPSNLDRQNVNLVLKIFNKFVIEGLLKLGPKHNITNFEDTANFIEIIRKWWDIFNVKTSVKGIHQRSDIMAPLTADKLDEKYKFLVKFLDWLDAWERMKCSTGSLSRETHTALVQTTYGMLQFVEYCIHELNMKYILTGKIQTDSLEARFGKYRQLAGSQYHISMRQLLECEKKLRLQSSVKLQLSINCKTVPLKDFDLSSSDVNLDNNLTATKFQPMTFSDEEFSNSSAYLPVLTYLGGYCSHTVIKKTKCDHCKENLILDHDVNLDENYSLIKNLDRGGLKCPNQFVVSVIVYNYLVVNKLYTYDEEFIHKINQKDVAINITLNTLKYNEIYFEECINGHSNDYISKLLLSASTNIMLKNLCGKMNDKLKQKSDVKKRKLETVKK